MSGATRVGLALLATGVALGVLGDALLRATPLGVNAPVWVAGFAGAGLALDRWRRPRPERRRAWLLALVVAFAALLVWRDSPWLVAINLAGLFTALSVALVRVPSFRLRRTDLSALADGAAATVGGAFGGAALTMVEDVRWRELPRGSHVGHVAAAGRGVALALPLLLVFGGLFVAADAAFEDLVTGLAPSDAASVVGHLAFAAVVGWVAVGVLRQFVRPADEAPPFDAPERTSRLGIVEVGLALALLDALFLVFVAVQVRYLFGGAGRVESEIGLTYAEYARRGFFELAVVAGLVLPLVLVADWALRGVGGRRAWAFRIPAGLLVALLFVVMASALERMRLYQDVYGLTELRVYATGFILWLAAVVAWAALTVLRGRRRSFLAGALAAGVAAIVGFNAVNPDALIARTNVERALERTYGLDATYLAGLSEDATPALVEALPSLDPWSQQVIAGELLSRGRSRDWRTWNYARDRADALVEQHRAELERLARRP